MFWDSCSVAWLDHEGLIECFDAIHTQSGFPQSWKVRESHGKNCGHGKVMENNKNVKSHGKVEILP